MAEQMVYIERASDGATLGVTPKAFEKNANGDYDGYRILRYEDGSEYEGPKTHAAIAKAAEKPAEKAADKPEKGGA